MFGRKKKLKAEIDENGRVYFWKNDADGFSQQDLMIVLTSAVFFGGIGIGLIISGLGMFLGFELPDKYIDLIRILDIPVSVILGGLFAGKIATTVVNRKSNESTEQEQKVYIGEENIYREDDIV